MVFASVYTQTGQFKKAAAAHEKKALSLRSCRLSILISLYGNVAYIMWAISKSLFYSLKKAIRIDPKPPGMVFAIFWALNYLWTLQNEKAIAVFKKLISREPKNADAHALLGCALLSQQASMKEAVLILDKVLRLNPDPDSPGWYVGHLSVARACAGQTEEAITTMQEVFNRNPKDAESCRNLSWLLIFGGRHEEALSMAKKSISLRPEPEREPFLYETLGASYLVMRQYGEAIAASKKAISFWPEYVYGHIDLTASYGLAGREEDARAEAAEVLRINPKITLEDIAKNGYYNFQKADKERFIDALRKAGLK